MAQLNAEIAAWQDDYNSNLRPVNWQFTTYDARVKLRKLYPAFQSGQNSTDTFENVTETSTKATDTFEFVSESKWVKGIDIDEAFEPPNYFFHKKDHSFLRKAPTRSETSW